MFPKICGAFGRAFVVASAVALCLVPAVVRAQDTGSYSCPVLHNAIDKVTKDTQFSDYKGVRYYYCCSACKPQFDKDQAKFLKDAKNQGKAIGMSLFDPVTDIRIESQKATGHSDYDGVRYFFAREDGKTAFDKEPKKYTVAPKNEVLFCPVSNEIVKSYVKASDYSNYKDTRYYFCCAGCKPEFDKNPDKYLDGLDRRIKAAREKAAATPEKDSKP